MDIVTIGEVSIDLILHGEVYCLLFTDRFKQLC
jgi:hypothetical protein